MDIAVTQEQIIPIVDQFDKGATIQEPNANVAITYVIEHST